jgi:hypothetical protein
MSRCAAAGQRDGGVAGQEKGNTPKAKGRFQAIVSEGRIREQTGVDENQRLFRRFGRQRYPPPCSGDCVMSAGLLRSRHRWQPQQSQVCHGSDGPGFRSDPKVHRAQKRPTQSADRSTATVDGVDQSFQEDLVRSKSRMFCDRNEKMTMENARAVRRSVDAHEEARERKRAETTPLRNEAQLNCVSLRSQLDCESDLRGCQGSR